MTSGGYQSAGLKRRQFARKVKWYIGVSGALILGIGLFYIIGFSGLFRVTRFEVVGATTGQENRILEVLRPQVVAGGLGGIFGADNYFSWSDELAYEDIRSNRVSIEKDFWDRVIRVIVHPRERYAVWCLISDDEIPGCNWIDAMGVAFEPAPTPEGQLVVTIFEHASNTAMVFGVPVMKQEYFEIVKRVTESLSSFALPVSDIVVDRSLEEMRIDTVSGSRILFSLRFDPTVAALPALKKLMASPGLSGMRTVDFTVENRVFYTVK